MMAIYESAPLKSPQQARSEAREMPTLQGRKEGGGASGLVAGPEPAWGRERDGHFLGKSKGERKTAF